MSNTLQLWPSGKTVTYSGEYPHYTVDGAPADAETSSEINLAIQAETLARNYAERDVLCCDSALVEKLIAEDFDGFAVDDIENSYRDFSDADVSECNEYIDEMGGDPPDDAEDLNAWREAANDCAADNPQEAYEWWRVSPWLCKELRAIGEIVIDNDYGCWWGRTCTGQGYIMDGTLQQIAANVLSR